MVNYFNTLISVQALQDIGGSTELLVCDCRFRLSEPEAGRKAYEQNHIPGAIYVDSEKDLSGAVTAQTGRHPLPEFSRWARMLQSWGVNPATQVVAYDDSFGSVAARLWWMCRWAGHQHVAVLDGGLQAWQRAGKAMDNRVPALRAGSQAYPQAHDDMWVSTEYVSKSLQDPGITLIDARAEPRFLAIEEPFDTIAGHIPGAVNIPFEDDLDLDGSFLQADALLDEYTEALGGPINGELVIMCGSGVTACHNVLALEHAGVTDVKLYAGSWSEWIRHEHLPKVTTG